MESTIGKFDREEIRPYEHHRIRMAKPDFELDEEKWVSDLENMRWFGPYTTENAPSGNKAFFVSKPFAGESSGFILIFDLKPNIYSRIVFLQRTQGTSGYLYQF